ncbi:MAG: hypothetical protein RIF46_04445 [Cyclobacteriaceae bacterium]
MPYYVITRTYLEDPSVKKDLLELTKASNQIFETQPGLIEMKSLLSENETHFCTYLVWDNPQSHLKCMESKDFTQVTTLWTGFMQQGKIKFELETYSELD